MSTKYTSPRALYNAIGQKYHDNRQKASNDVSELPATLQLLGNLQGKQVLDMGCGLGKHAEEFMKRGAIVTGYDASEKMVQLARQYCQNKGTFLRATHETANFDPQSFDVCNASFSINYSKDIDRIFQQVQFWLKPNGVFTFSIPHPVWLLSRSENMDFSYPHKIWVRLNSYVVDIFNYYHPLDSFIQLASTYNFTIQRILETTIPRKYQNWPEEKYRLPNAYAFKLQKRNERM